MPGRGPTPKPDASRRRRNVATSAAVLPSQRSMRERFKGRRGSKLPKSLQLPPALSGREWHQRTLDWWQEAVTSPMATRWLDADRHGLYAAFEIIDEFYFQLEEPRGTKGRAGRIGLLAAEIRQQIARFGLSPRDRLALHWAVADDEEDETPKRGGGGRPPSRITDYRASLGQESA